MRLKPIEEQVIAVVGAASGIGRETALLAARRGAAVSAFDNDEEGLTSLAEEVQRSGGRIGIAIGDVADFDALRSFADSTVATYGGLDTWAHCAAVALYAPFTETTVEEFQRVLDVDLLGQIYGAKAALPHLSRTGGALVHVSSIEARRSLPYHSAYAAAKHGITGFVEALRLELRHDHVSVSVTEIMPASINTPFFDHAETKLGVKPIGLPPLYEPRTVADAILYAAEHPVRELIVGGTGKMLLSGQRLSPRLVDMVLQRIGFAGQRTNEPRSANASNTLFGPSSPDHRVEGDFGSMTLQHSLSTWLDTNPVVKTAAAAAVAVGLGAVLSGRGKRNDTPVRTIRERVPVPVPTGKRREEGVLSGGWH